MEVAVVLHADVSQHAQHRVDAGLKLLIDAEPAIVDVEPNRIRGCTFVARPPHVIDRECSVGALEAKGRQKQ